MEFFLRLFFLSFFFFTVDLLARFKGWHKLLPRLIAWWAFLNLRATRKRNRSARGSILWIVTHTTAVAPYFLVSLTLSFHHLWGKRKNRGFLEQREIDKSEKLLFTPFFSAGKKRKKKKWDEKNKEKWRWKRYKECLTPITYLVVVFRSTRFTTATSQSIFTLFLCMLLAFH